MCDGKVSLKARGIVSEGIPRQTKRTLDFVISGASAVADCINRDFSSLTVPYEAPLATRLHEVITSPDD